MATKAAPSTINLVGKMVPAVVDKIPPHGIVSGVVSKCLIDGGTALDLLSLIEAIACKPRAARVEAVAEIRLARAMAFGAVPERGVDMFGRVVNVESISASASRDVK